MLLEKARDWYLDKREGWINSVEGSCRLNGFSVAKDKLTGNTPPPDHIIPTWIHSDVIA